MLGRQFALGLCADRAAGNRSEEPAFSGGVRLLGGGQADRCAQAVLGDARTPSSVKASWAGGMVDSLEVWRAGRGTCVNVVVT